MKVLAAIAANAAFAGRYQGQEWIWKSYKKILLQKSFL